jgi:hypothetical protein
LLDVFYHKQTVTITTSAEIVFVSPWSKRAVVILSAAVPRIDIRVDSIKVLGVRAIFQATVVAKLSFASPAWWEFASAADKDRLEAFLRRSSQLEYQEKSAPTLDSICDEAQ